MINKRMQFTGNKLNDVQTGNDFELTTNVFYLCIRTFNHGRFDTSILLYQSISV